MIQTLSNLFKTLIFRLRWILIFLVIVLANFTIGNAFLFGDSYGYYFHAQNFLSTNGADLSSDYLEYAGHGVSLNQTLETQELNAANANYVSAYPQGNSIIWMPFLWLSTLLDFGLLDSYGLLFNGHELTYTFAIQVAASLFFTLGIYFTYKFLVYFFSKKISLIAAVLSAFGGQMLAYTLFYTGYSHVYEYGLFAFILYAATYLGKQVHIKFKQKLIFTFLILTVGILISVRVVDGILLLPIVLLLWPKKKLMLLSLLGIILGVVLFALNNLNSFGCLSCTGYGASGQGLSLSVFNLPQLLFSDVRGWFIYTPLALLSIFGTIFMFIKNRFSPLENIRHFAYLAAIILLTTVYTFWPNWWGGDSLGQRFLLVLTPLIAYGIAVLISEFKQKLFRIIIFSFILVFSFYSFSLNILYRITPTSRLGEIYHAQKAYLEVPISEYFTPISMFRYHLDLINNSKTLNEYADNLMLSFNNGRSLLMIKLGLVDPLLKIESLKATVNDLNQEIISIKYLDLAKNEPVEIFLEIPNKGVFALPLNANRQNLQSLSLTRDQLNMLSSQSISKQIPDYYLQYALNEDIKLYVPAQIKLVKAK